MFFTLSEFACHDGTPVPEHLIPNVAQLITALDVIRKETGPLYITSGYRTVSYNKKVKGKPNSVHLIAKAADLVCKNLSPRQLHRKISSMIKDGSIPDGGLGLYPSFVHYDIGRPRRWYG